MEKQKAVKQNVQFTNRFGCYFIPCNFFKAFLVTALGKLAFKLPRTNLIFQECEITDEVAHVCLHCLVGSGESV